jgi:hypothetical protein
MNETSETPKKRTQPPKGWRRAFLKVLAVTCNVGAACRVARVGRATAYRHRHAEPKFARAWDDACEDAADLLELEARRRAVEGVEKPVFYRGERVGVVREYSDSLLMFLLKGCRPEKFRENFDFGNLIRDYARSVESKGVGPARGDRR